jgi:hypothetical protein
MGPAAALLPASAPSSSTSLSARVTPAGVRSRQTLILGFRAFAILFVTRRDYAARAQRISVPKVGGLPCMSNPIRNTFAANQIAAHAAPSPTTTVSHTCHAGGGASEASRDSIANVLTGGRKLTTMLKVEFGE